MSYAYNKQKELIDKHYDLVEKLYEEKRNAEKILDDIKKLSIDIPKYKEKAEMLSTIESTDKTKITTSLIDYFRKNKQFYDDIKDKVSADINLIPVGAVVTFFLSSNEIDQLSPVWHDADGSVVKNENSKLFGMRLPDLKGRFILGASGNSNIVDNQNNVGGSTDITIGIDTSKTVYSGLDDTIRSVGLDDGSFVIDTKVDESKISNHYHQVSGTVPNVIPPYRKLIFMVKIL